ncbi:MAG TPA: DUF2332 family protein [Nannocystaceae bacterium]|nr:DUF2332 family protein [Nannocystaceae bacterium]
MSIVASHTGVDGLAEDLAQHHALIAASSVVYAQALTQLQALLTGPTAERVIVERMEHAWRQRTFRAYYERPLLLLAALRYEAITIPEHPLALAFADEHPRVELVTRAALTRALSPDRLSLWLLLATRRVQTNDVSRAVAWRWPASMIDGRPLALVDVGCSAGLGLVADRLAAPWVDGEGRRLPVDGGRVLARIGYDAHPIELGDRDEGAAWLRACIWPGDLVRLRRLDAAIEAFRGELDTAVRPRVEQVRARSVPGRLRRIERELEPDALILIVESFVREYIEQEEAETYQAEMEQWLAATPKGRALWMQLDLARDDREPVAVLTAYPSRGKPIVLARCGYHPIEIAVQPGAPDRLRAALAR